MIALSIVFLAAEVIRMRNGEVVLTQRYPWVVAFGFGLIHGLGFAGALSQIGIPEHEVPLSLLMFNLGVETGQIAVRDCGCDRARGPFDASRSHHPEAHGVWPPTPSEASPPSGPSSDSSE